MGLSRLQMVATCRVYELDAMPPLPAELALAFSVATMWEATAAGQLMLLCVMPT